MGNLLWAGSLPPYHLEALHTAIAAIAAAGYFASPFPEGDGVTFQRYGEPPYDPDASLAHFRDAFPFLEITVLGANENLAAALARLASGHMTTCTYLVPVEGLRLDAPLDLGNTRFHAPVDGEDNRLADHAWPELCEEPGADVNPSWSPSERASGTTELLRYPLIERTVEVPMSLLFDARTSFDGQSPLLRLLMEDADRALDPVRFDLCHYRRLHHLPAKPGWIGETALAYVIPESPALETRYLQGKPYVLRVSNNWLGLELDEGSLSAALPLADMVVDNNAGGEITLALKAAVRAYNRAFYLVDLEASFLHLVYAIDALCGPGPLKGDSHRIWISAFGSEGKVERFEKVLADFDQHYRVRNLIVHEGATFAGLGLTGEEQCQAMMGLLRLCILTFLWKGFASQREAAEFAFRALTSSQFQPHLTAMASKHFKLPLTSDKAFTRHMQ